MNILADDMQLFSVLIMKLMTICHTHTHPFNGPLSGTTDSEWQWHQLGHMQVCTALQTDSHASTPPLTYDDMPLKLLSMPVSLYIKFLWIIVKKCVCFPLHVMSIFSLLLLLLLSVNLLSTVSADSSKLSGECFNATHIRWLTIDVEVLVVGELIEQHDAIRTRRRPGPGDLNWRWSCDNERQITRAVWGYNVHIHICK